MSKKKKDYILTSWDKNFILGFVLVALIFGFLVVSPFSRGLFNGRDISFEGPIYNALIFGSILLLLLAAYFFKHYKVQEVSGALAIAIWLLPLTYLISYFTAVSPHAAKNSVLIHMLYAVFFIAALFLGKNRTLKQYLFYSLLAAGYLIVVFGLMNWFGDASLWGLITYEGTGNVYNAAVMDTNVGIRLTSVFQYPNSYAALLIGLYAATLIMLVHSKRWYTSLIYGAWLVPILLSLLLTLSRAGYLILPVVILLMLPLLSISKQIAAIIHIVISGVGTLILLQPVSQIGSEALNGANTADILMGWLSLIGVSFAAAGISWLVQRFLLPWISSKLQSLEKRRMLSRLGLFSIMIILGLLGLYVLFGTNFADLLPPNIGERISSISFQHHSVLERITFYSDALKIIRDYPLSGTGGGGWSAIYMQYQNNPYTSAQAHNFLLQYMIETGMLGFLVFAVIVGYILIRYLVKQHREDDYDVPTLAFTIFLAGLGIHSIIDFNMSYVYLGAVFFLSLGAIASELNGNVKILNKPKLSVMNKAYPIAIIMIALVFAFISIQKSSAYYQYKKALADAQTGEVYFNEIEQNMRGAIQKDPTNPVYKLQMAVFYISAYNMQNDKHYLDQAMSLVNQAAEQEPYNRDVYNVQTQILELKHDDQAMLALNESMIKKYPWDINYYESAIVLHYELGKQAEAEGKTEIMEQHWKRIDELVSVIETKVEYLKTLPEGQLPGRPFEITDQIQAVLEEIQ